MKKLIQELKGQGIDCSYESHIEVDPPGIIVGLFLISIPIVFAFVFDVFSFILLLPGLLGIFLVIVGIMTFSRKSFRKSKGRFSLSVKEEGK